MRGLARYESVFKSQLAIVAALILSGCLSSPERERKQEAQRILERTITETKVETVTVDRYVPLPTEITQKCQITYRKDDSVLEYVRVADTNTLYLERCARQVEGARKLQPTK